MGNVPGAAERRQDAGHELGRRLVHPCNRLRGLRRHDGYPGEEKNRSRDEREGRPETLLRRGDEGERADREDREVVREERDRREEGECGETPRSLFSAGREDERREADEREKR